MEPLGPAESSQAPREPFASEPAQLGGCGKPAVIGCVVLLVVVAAGLLVLMWKAQDLLAFAIGEYRSAVEQSLPDDLEPGERERLGRAFDSALEAIEKGELQPAAAQELQRALSSPPRPGEKMERDRVLELIRALEALGSDDAARHPEAGRPRDSATASLAAVALGAASP